MTTFLFMEKTFASGGGLLGRDPRRSLNAHTLYALLVKWRMKQNDKNGLCSQQGLFRDHAIVIVLKEFQGLGNRMDKGYDIKRQVYSDLAYFFIAIIQSELFPGKQSVHRPQ